MIDADKHVLTVTPIKAANMLGVSRWQIYQYIKIGLIKCLPTQKHNKLIPVAELERFANQLDTKEQLNDKAKNNNQQCAR